MVKFAAVDAWDIICHVKRCFGEREREREKMKMKVSRSEMKTLVGRPLRHRDCALKRVGLNQLEANYRRKT